MTEQEKKEITEVIQGIIDNNTHQESNAEKRRKILSIRDRAQRQMAIRENMGLFAEGCVIGGKKA